MPTWRSFPDTPCRPARMSPSSTPAVSAPRRPEWFAFAWCRLLSLESRLQPVSASRPAPVLRALFGVQVLQVAEELVEPVDCGEVLVAVAEVVLADVAVHEPDLP